VNISKDAIVKLSRNLILAAAYFLGSQTVEFVGLTDEFGTLMWPPSGFALAGIVLYGRQVWWGVLLGAFFANLYVFSANTETLGFLAYLIVFIESCGALSGALAGAWLMKRLAHFPNPLFTEKQIGLFYLAAILASFISPTIAMTTLIIAHDISIDHVMSHWIDWYFGDLIGVAIFTPLVLIWLHPCSYFINRRIIVSATMLIAILFVVILARYEFEEEYKRLHYEFEKDALAVQLNIEKHFLSYSNTVGIIANFYASSNHINRRQFSIFTSHFFHDLNAIQAFEFSQVVSDSQRKNFESAIQKEGFADFKIRERNVNKTLVAAGSRDRYIVVNFIEPMKGNEPAFGFDTLSDVQRAEIFNYAQDTGQLTITPKLTLIQETGSQFGILMVMPVYQHDMPHTTVEERKKSIEGFIVGVFRINDMMNAALKEVNHHALHVQIIDQHEGSDPVVFFDDQLHSLNTKNLRTSQLRKSSTITFGDHVFDIGISATNTYIDEHNVLSATHIHADFSWHLFFAGLLLSSLMGSVALIITGRKMQLEELISIRTAQVLESEKKFRIAADSAPIMIWMAGKDTLCYWFNQVWLNFVGRTLEQEYGNGWAEGVHPDDFDRCLDIYIKNFNLRQPFKMEYRLKHHSGEYRWILDSGVPRFDISGEFEGYIGSCTDINELKVLQFKAEELGHSKTMFLANMSHEIRTPMNAIMGLSQLALGTKENKDEYLKKILQASGNLMGILNDILEFSKLDEGHVKINNKNIEIDDLIANLHTLFEDMSRQKGLVVEFDVASEVPRHLIGDEQKLQQVLTNLIGNAIKFTLDGFVRLTIDLISNDGHTACLRFCVTDSGIGMDELQQENLFMPFAQLDYTHSRRFGGTGLGLAISQQFVQLMGGVIQCTSKPEVGSEFSFAVPFLIADRPPARSNESHLESLSSIAPVLQNIRVLLVEDNPINQMVASEFLRKAKIIVTIADNGKHALELLEIHVFDVILMDIQMPVMNGLEATRLIRQNKNISSIPVIAMSAGVTLDEQVKCRSVGVSSFIPKPFNNVELLQKIADNLVRQ
jgi:two-component system CheB/CheR fusion protein